MNKRPFFLCLQITAALYLALIIFNKISGIGIPSALVYVFWALLAVLMILSHFKERPLPYFYPILFAAAVFATAMGWVHYTRP